MHNWNFSILLLIGFVFMSCGDNEKRLSNRVDSLHTPKTEIDTLQIKSDTVPVFKDYSLHDFLNENQSLDNSINKIFDSMTDEERAAQLIVSSTGHNGKPLEHVKNLVRRKSIGGVILMGGDFSGIENTVKSLDRVSSEAGSLPLLLSMDAEPSLMNQRIKGIERITPTSKLNSKSNLNTADQISEILKNFGVNQNYAPVCDSPVNTDIISNRSYGGNNENIQTLAGDFVKVMQSNNIIATAKHFPGHGNVAGDSHKGLVYINGELDEIEVFEGLINLGVMSVMVGHIAIEDNKRYSTNGLPSTLSRNIVTGLLKEELGFKGLVVTDAMNMGAVINFKTPSLQAVKAGCDMILMPKDETKLLSSILNEMNSDEHFKQQVYSSCKKIIRAKICLGLLN